MGHQFEFLVDDDSTNEGKMKGLTDGAYIGSLFRGKEETLHWCRGFENTIFGSKGGGSQSTSDNWRLKSTYSLS
jgi:hypothetical protein